MKLLKRSNAAKAMSGIALCAVLFLIPGCDWSWIFGKKAKPRQVIAEGVTGAKGTGAVLAEIRGKPVIMESAFNDKLRQMLQANAYTKDIDPATVPSEAKLKLLNDWLNVILIKEVWGSDNKIKDSSEFKRELADRVEALEDALVVEKFVASMRGEITVKDSEIQKEFDNNKERYTKVAGGVRLAGAKFASEEDAKNFATSVSAKTIADFEKAAKAAKKATYRDFGRVTEAAFRGAPDKVAKKALGMKKFPGAGIVEVGDKEFWVVFVMDKKDAEFYKFDEVKPQIKSMLEEKAFGEILNSKLEGFKEGSSLKVNEDFFRK
ncbi:peptidyl-prolyl cis-trans isomerase [Candidatus Dependentiae bacterium]